MTKRVYKYFLDFTSKQQDWIIVENTHEAIISREDWQKCNDMMTPYGHVRMTKESEILPFTGVLK